ncbi:MAG: folylpolyglutamate synthase/dihydrofolate synthase family protein [Longimicrobiales bacterium]|nr:folylpolyglutamate synthase/dihydrofolate synthase family protein [Longimicrobiales bacterium]
MTELSYGALLDQLFPRLTGGIRWGLDRTRRMLDAVGDPHTAYPAIHIAGTNGKGSVAAIMESVLRRQGLRTGLYTSPHLVDFRERIRIDGRPITESELLTTARALWPAIEAEAPSFFEAATVIGFLAMERAAVDVAVVEVGMGGRLDSTNVVSPDVTIITNVALDHAQYLGDDLATIAGEKAGIIKPGVPVVTGATEPEVLEGIRSAARARGAPVHEVPPPVAELDARGTTVVLDTVWGELSLRVPLAGRHQAQNLAVAVRALELLPEARRPSRAALVEGAAGVRWPGRLQSEDVDGVTWVFDVAHNAAGARSLLDALPVLRPARPMVALIGVLGDKDWNAMLPPLFRAMDGVVLAEPPSAPPERRWDPESVLERLSAPDHVRVVRPFAAAVAEAAGRADGGTVVCTGSVHTVGDAMLALGLPPFADPAGLQPEGDAA